jgi:NAD(P)-dependent dehydrogenase (short-subunit alcohol dehydrogenase family)
MSSGNGRIALVTGANRGLGLETCRQLAGFGWRVLLAARDVRAACEAAALLKVDCLRLDVADPESVRAAASVVGERHGRLDALVNNAGVLLDGFDAAIARQTMDVNFHGAVAVTDAFRPLLSRGGSIVNVSSGMGELSCLSPELAARFSDARLTRSTLEVLVEDFVRDVEEGTVKVHGWPKSAYSVSKVALNAFTRVLARELRGTGIRANAVCPGWVRTDMGGSSATRTIRKGAESIVWGATLGPDGPTDGFFRDGRAISW